MGCNGYICFYGLFELWLNGIVLLWSDKIRRVEWIIK